MSDNREDYKEKFHQELIALIDRYPGLVVDALGGLCEEHDHLSTDAKIITGIVLTIQYTTVDNDDILALYTPINQSHYLNLGLATATCDIIRGV